METPKKICARCKQEKDLINFGKSNHAWCKACRSAYCKLWYQNPQNKERKNEKNRAWNQKNKRKKRAWFLKNKERINEKKRAWSQKNKERISEKNKLHRCNMSTIYIKKLIKNRSDLKAKDITADLIETWRLNLTLKRLKKEKMKC